MFLTLWNNNGLAKISYKHDKFFVFQSHDFLSHPSFSSCRGLQFWMKSVKDLVFLKQLKTSSTKQTKSLMISLWQNHKLNAISTFMISSDKNFPGQIGTFSLIITITITILGFEQQLLFTA